MALCALPQNTQVAHLLAFCLLPQSLQCSEGTAEADFSCLPLLEELCLAGNGLEQLPPGVAALTALTVLDLTDNRPSSLPAGAYLAGLRKLSVARNPHPAPAGSHGQCH